MSTLQNDSFCCNDESRRRCDSSTRSPMFYLAKTRAIGISITNLGKMPSNNRGTKTISKGDQKRSCRKLEVQTNANELETRIYIQNRGGNFDKPKSRQKENIHKAEKSSTLSAHNRPYLLSNATFNRLRMIVTIGMLSANFPWRWNNRTKRIDRWNPVMVKLWKLYWYLSVLQSMCMLLYHMQCLKGMYSRNLESYRGIFAYSGTLYWYSCHLGYRTCMFLYEDDMRKYINRLQDLNGEYVDKYLIYADKNIELGVGRMVMNLSIPIAAFQIANSLFMFLIKPSAPYFLTSNIKPLLWYALIPGALQDLTVTGQTIGTYLILSWLQVSHTSSMEFWLREMHKDSKAKYVSDELRQPNVAIPTYRVLQLMSSRFNDCMASLCIPVWKFSVAFGFIQCGFLWLRSMNRVFLEEFPGILVYPFGVVNCFTMGFGCLAMAARMYDNAKMFLHSWGKTTRKEMKKALLSCPALRMKVGKFYFITIATTVTFFEVLIHYIIDCIITFP